MIAKSYKEYRVEEIQSKAATFRNIFSSADLSILVSKEDAEYLLESPFFISGPTIDSSIINKLTDGLSEDKDQYFLGMLDISSSTTTEKILVYLDTNLSPLEVRYNVTQKPTSINTISTSGEECSLSTEAC